MVGVCEHQVSIITADGQLNLGLDIDQAILTGVFFKLYYCSWDSMFRNVILL